MTPHPLSINFQNAYYLKLGAGGKWEADSIQDGFLRFGWAQQSLSDLNDGKWDAVSSQLLAQYSKNPHVATNYLRRLQDIVDSTSDDIWITFHKAKMWWARVGAGPVEEDIHSKFRRVLGTWSDKSISGRTLIANELPGKLAQLQGFWGTVCRVREFELLRRVLNGERSAVAFQISVQRAALESSISQAIRELHWKDYETLVDLVFRHTGWTRVSVLGQHAKAYDLELREPVTNDRYVVQIKSRASKKDLDETVAQFSTADYRKVFFVVHTPTKDLAQALDVPEHVELVAPETLARLALEAGLSSWIEEKVA